MSDAISIRGLSFAYETGAATLHDLRLEIRGGECVGIVGPNGAGKSTLLLHLNGILPEEQPQSPHLFIGELPVCKATLPEIRRRVGLMFQDPDDQIFCPTVFEDVAFGPEQLGMTGALLQQTVHTALARVRLDGFEKRSPHHLSLGEKRRVCLAGVLACDPSVLVLDEPTSDLDPRGRRELVELLRHLPATRVIASHDLDMIVALCSSVFLIDQGHLVAHGPTRELLADEPLMLAHGLEKPHSLQHLHPH